MSFLDAILMGMTGGDRKEAEYLKQKYFLNKFLEARAAAVVKATEEAGRRLTINELISIDWIGIIMISGSDIPPLVSRDVVRHKHKNQIYFKSKRMRFRCRRP